MSNDNRNSNSNWYTTLAYEEEIESLHTISDDSIPTVQAITDKAEERQLKIELKLLEEEEQINMELKLLDTTINQVSKVFSTLIGKYENKLNFEDEDMTSVLPVLMMKEEFRNSVEGVVVRADAQLFKDEVSNVLAKSSHPLHSGGCAHLLDDKDRYYERVGDKKATLPKVTRRQTIPDKLVTTSTVEWKHFEQLKKVFELETHCRDKYLEFIVNCYLVIIARLKTRFDDLPLDLNLQAFLTHIFSNVTDVVTTREEYVKTHVKLLKLSFQANEEDGLPNYLNQVTKMLRRLTVLNGGKDKCELRKIDKDWAKDDKDGNNDTRFERFKTY